jgi:hypothetical protein
MSIISATVIECGNGFPGIGDYLPGDDGKLYRVDEVTSRIQTDQPRWGYYVFANLEEAHWDDVNSDDNLYPASAVIPSTIETRDVADKGV